MVCAQQERVVKRLYGKRAGRHALEGPELRDFMQEYVRQLPGHESRVVTDDEVIYVMNVADTLGTGELNGTEVTKAVATWQALLADQELIDSKFNFYDRDSNGTLDKAEVGALLKELNGGAEVSAAETDWVIAKADGKATGVQDGAVDRNELKVGLTVWYAMQAEKRQASWSCCCGGQTRVVEADNRSQSHRPVRSSQLRFCMSASCCGLRTVCCVLCCAVRLNLVYWSACRSLLLLLRALQFEW